MSEQFDTTGEVWKTIAEFPNYAVSSLARVKRITHPIRTAGGIIRQFINQSGYWEVTLKHGKIRKRRQVHRLFALSFLPPDPNPARNELNHKNGIRHDNTLENLEWVTHQENMWHAYHVSNGQALKGEEAVHAKLTEADVFEIRYYVKLGMTNAAIGGLFGVSATAIYWIRIGKNWKHI